MSLDNARLLLVTGVEGKVDKLWRFVVHILTFCLCCFDQVESNIKNQVGKESKEDIFEALVLSCQTQILKGFFDEVGDSFFVKQLLQIGSLSEDDKRLDHKGHQVLQAKDDLVLLSWDQKLSLLILLFQKEVDALERLGFELIYQIV